jgi:hypothetical protein
VPPRLEQDVDSGAVVRRADAPGEAPRVAVDCGIGVERERQAPLLLGGSDGVDARGAVQPSELDRQAADASGRRHDGDCVARLEASPGQQRTPGRHALDGRGQCRGVSHAPWHGDREAVGHDGELGISTGPTGRHPEHSRAVAHTPAHDLESGDDRERLVGFAHPFRRREMSEKLIPARSTWIKVSPELVDGRSTSWT